MSTALVVVAICFAAFNVGAAVLFRQQMYRQAQTLSQMRNNPATRSAWHPKVVVVLCVRGQDPFLAETLRRLAAQRYSNFRIIVVVDHQQDPAWKTVGDVILELGLNETQLERQELVVRNSNCGLKCSALRQAITSLARPSEFDDLVIVTVDSDAVPGPEWLNYLLIALADPQVGAATSNQWFQPQSATLGSWVRSVWQAGAVVPTAILGNPWAGTFAIRHSDLIASGLLDEWGRSIVDDGPVLKCLKSIQKRVVFVPQNMVINREACELGFCFRYIARMLTWSRLFESTFWITCIHALLTVGGQFTIGAWLLLAIGTELARGLGFSVGSFDLPAATIAAFSILAGQAIGYFVIRNTVLSAISQGIDSQADFLLRSERVWHSVVPGAKTDKASRPSPPWWSQVSLVLCAIPITTLAYGLGCLFALRARRIVWRNVTYEINGGRHVKLIEYAPYQEEATSELEHHSI